MTTALIFLSAWSAGIAAGAVLLPQQPVAGLVGDRTFLGHLSHHTFLATQYMRHPSRPPKNICGQGRRDEKEAEYGDQSAATKH